MLTYYLLMLISFIVYLAFEGVAKRYAKKQSLNVDQISSSSIDESTKSEDVDVKNDEIEIEEASK